MMNLIFTGLKNGVVPYGTELIFPPTPSAQALGYNTSPLWGCSPFRCPTKLVPTLATGRWVYNVQRPGGASMSFRLSRRDFLANLGFAAAATALPSIPAYA